MLFGLFARIYICVVCYLPILNVDCIFCIVLFVLYMFCVFVSICAYLLSPFVILFCGVCVLVGCSISIFCSAFLHLFFYFGVLHLYISINFIILHFDSYFLGWFLSFCSLQQWAVICVFCCLFLCFVFVF